MSVAPVRRRRTPPAHQAVDLARVQVAIAGPAGRTTAVGSAAQALRDARLTASERAAVDSLVRAVRLLRIRAGFSGIDDAGTAVRLVLRDADAATSGPWATVGTVAVGARNGLATRGDGRGRPDVLLTVDCAIHELVHVTQFARMRPGSRPHAAILEGVADAAAMLATGDDTLGEGFFRSGPDGRPRGSIRELGRSRASGPPLGSTITRYRDAVMPGTEEHAAGGVVTATFAAIRARLGRARAEQLLWAVIRDEQAWERGGSWAQLATAIRRCAAARWPEDMVASAAVDAALGSTGLSDALPR